MIVTVVRSRCAAELEPTAAAVASDPTISDARRYGFLTRGRLAVNGDGARMLVERRRAQP